MNIFSRAINRVFGVKVANAMLTGAGAGTTQDRGSLQHGDNATLNPYFNNNFISRWQEYIRWYMTSWEARKLVDIPIQDALREQVEIAGIDEETSLKLMDAYEAFDADRQLRRALIQERLLGGSLILGVFNRPENEEVSTRLRPSAIERGDLLALNVVDVSMLQRPVWIQDPFDPDFDRLGEISIQGVTTHTSRMIVFDGQSLLSRNRQVLMGTTRVNPVGFGESVLAPLYDLLIRVTGTQQGAYHLVNLASCLIIGVKDLRALKAVNNKALEKLEEIQEMLSMYRGAIVDGEDVEFCNYSATFGSVPELVMTFMQLLSAASDIPATRFLGQAPGGLNATGQADLENYYNNIRAWQQQHLKRAQRKLFDWLGAHLWGWKEWQRRSEKLELKYKPLWNISAVEQANVDNTYVQAINTLVQAGIIDAPSAVEELKKRDLFKGEVAPGDPLALDGGDDLGLSGLMGGDDKKADEPALGQKADKMSGGIGKTANDKSFDESKVKRDHGEFAKKDGGDSEGTPDSDAPIELTGDELGQYKDVKELREKARQYFKDHLQGETITREGLGEVRFSRKGIDETIAWSADEDKLKAIPAIEQVIKTGKIGKEEPLNHPRKDGIVAFVPITKTISLAGKPRDIEVLLAKDENGNLYYDLFLYGTRKTKTPISNMEQNPCPMGVQRPPDTLSQIQSPAGVSSGVSNPTVKNSITQPEYEINIRFVDEEGGGNG